MDQSFDGAVLAHHPDAIIVLDPNGIVLHWNAAAESIFGYMAVDAIGHALCDLIVVQPDEHEKFTLALRQAEISGLYIDESVRRRKDGARIHTSGSTKAVRDFDGVLEYFVITQKDVTPLKVAREVKLVEAKYRDLLEHTPDAILIVNATGHLIMANAQTLKVFGYTRQQLIGQPVETLLPIRYRRTQMGHDRRHFDQPRTGALVSELFGERRNGDEFPVEISLSPLDTEEGIMVMWAVRDITGSREARSKSDRKFRDLLESAPDAMVIVDESGAIVFVNSQTVRQFGWTHDELLGRPVETLMPERFRDSHPVHRSAFFTAPKLRYLGARRELYGLRKDGSEFPVEISLSPIQTEDGLVIASTIRDASDRKYTEQLLHEANRLKSEFLANMSHELRTPLNGILGFSELLLDQRIGDLNGKQREYVGAILECGKHLLQLINEVLDLSKVEAGKMEVYVEAFSPRTAIASVFTAVGTLARKKGIRLHGPTGDAVETITVDLQKFRQILFNLLSNAIKFTDPNGEVHVELEAEGADRFCLTVRDNGIGIAPADMEHLFEAFRQLDAGAARRNEGTGLGLTLTRRLVELQGGTIDVESVRCHGTTFTVHLPTTATGAPPAPRPS